MQNTEWISPLISESCVLQRGAQNKIRGYAAPGNKVTMQVCFPRGGEQRDFTLTSAANEEGVFELTLKYDEGAAGITLVFAEYGGNDGEERFVCRREIKDIAFGDVFLLGGQSNMELPVSRTLDVTEGLVENAGYSDIREFVVPMEPVFGRTLSCLSGGKWKKAEGEAVGAFGAAGFFMARRLYEKYRVPIGLIQTAVGGTPIQAWCSEKTIRELGEYTEEMEQCFDGQWTAQVQKEETLAERKWHEDAWVEEEGERESESIRIPGLWQDTELAGFHGSLILERDFWMEETAVGMTPGTDAPGEEKAESGKEKAARAYIGAIVDADRVYINGHRIGETGYCYPPRKYDFPAHILKAGRNHIRIEMMVFRGTGGFIPGKPYYVRWGDRECSLEGQWRYQIVKRMEELPQTTFFQYKPTALYNGMLAPLSGLCIKALVFYQGESNTGRPQGYGKYFDKALEDWRALFGGEDLPAVYVQLAGFADSEKPCRATEWAELREEQRKSLHNKNVAMVTALDLGEYNDLHPQRKAELGERLALAADALAFGGKAEYSGPVFWKTERQGSAVRLFFAHAGRGLVSREGEGRIYGMELAGRDGIFYEADACIEAGRCPGTGDSLLVSSPCVEEPCFCRYAWNNFPEKANLYNREGLPASPFLEELSQ